MGDLADNIAAQARELFAELPEGAVGEDEELFFRTDGAGNLMVLVPRTKTNYRLSRGRAQSARRLPGHKVEICTWDHGTLIEMQVYDLVQIEAERWQGIPPSA